MHVGYTSAINNIETHSIIVDIIHMNTIELADVTIK